MGNADNVYPAGVECAHRVPIPPPRSFFETFRGNMKETFFPDDPFKQFKNAKGMRRFILGLQYFFPFLEWAPRYSFNFFKSDLIAGITVASLAIPQGISYAKLANLPPILGLYSSFVPPLVYAMMGSSRDLAVGTAAVGSLLISSMIGKEVSPQQDPTLYLHLALTAAFFSGCFQAALGLLRLGFIVDFLSHATIVGFMAGAAIVVCLQQLKGILGLQHFTTSTDLPSVMESIFTQTKQSKKRPQLFWVSAAAPLTTVVLGSVVVYFTRAENHGVQVIGYLTKGLNPPSITSLTFSGPYIMVAFKTGIVTGTIALAVSSLYPTFSQEDKLKATGENSLQYVVLDMGAVASIDTSGISMLDEVKKSVVRRGLQLVLANPGTEVMKKLDISKILEAIGQEWIFLTVGEAVGACNFLLHTCKGAETVTDEGDNNV